MAVTMVTYFVLQSSLLLTLATGPGTGEGDGAMTRITLARLRALHTIVLALVVGASSGCAFFWQQPGTPLARAAHTADVEAIRSLIAGGADPNQFDATGQTAMHWAARGGHRLGPHTCRGEAASRPAVITALVDAGADLNPTDRRGAIPGGSSGWTPLHVALHHEQFKTAARLLERGANPNIRSHQGTTVMAMAAEEGAPAEFLQDLLARGFDPRRARTPRQ
jgi:ankyrin repeat protein